MDRREIERLLAVVREADAAGQRAAIATVVRIRGSAYRREGARVVIREDGSYACLVSGGCLEPAVAEAAARVIATGEPLVARYDLLEDSVWALGVGCSGEVDIRIERVDRDPLTRTWLAILDRGEAAVLVTPLAAPSGRLLVHADRSEGTLGSAALDAAAAVHARILMQSPHDRSGPESIAGLELFFEVSTPPPALVIFGAGDDAVPLARQAYAMGFDVTVVDVREAFLTAERFPHATLVLAHFTAFASRVVLGARCFAVVMNHHLERDEESLAFALVSPAPYVGVLGPASRYARMLTRLQATGRAADSVRLGCVRSPVGLALGAETPEEVAVAILGEIVALRRGFTGGFLSGFGGSLHLPADSRSLARS
jgi:xanthine/CO dehydrogenase XdhC/CoxF family maturation factor